MAEFQTAPYFGTIGYVRGAGMKTLMICELNRVAGGKVSPVVREYENFMKYVSVGVVGVVATAATGGNVLVGAVAGAAVNEVDNLAIGYINNTFFSINSGYGLGGAMF